MIKSFLDELRELKTNDAVDLSSADFSQLLEKSKLFASSKASFQSSELLKFSSQNVFFLNTLRGLIVKGVSAIKEVRDLEESLTVQLEINLQLLSSQIDRVVRESETNIQRQEAVLGMLLNKTVIAVSGILISLRDKLFARGSYELSSNLDLAITQFLALNADRPRVVQNYSEKVATDLIDA